nr:hypothetical protein [uncultured Moraxella sp.]
MKNNANSALKPVYPIHQKLKISYITWLIFRLFGVAILSFLLLKSQPSVIGGMVWQGLWLLPAVLCTPVIVKGKSPYALLLVSMLLLVYMGGSGMVALKHGFSQVWALCAVWIVDFYLLTLVNVWLFVLLKRLPKMNG